MLTFKFIIILIGIVFLLTMTPQINPEKWEIKTDDDKDTLQNEPQKLPRKLPRKLSRKHAIPPSVKTNRARVIQFLEQERRESPNNMEVAFFRSNPEMIHFQMIDILHREFGHIETQNLIGQEAYLLPHVTGTDRCRLGSSRA